MDGHPHALVYATKPGVCETSSTQPIAYFQLISLILGAKEKSENTAKHLLNDESKSITERHKSKEKK